MINKDRFEVQLEQYQRKVWQASNRLEDLFRQSRLVVDVPLVAVSLTSNLAFPQLLNDFVVPYVVEANAEYRCYQFRKSEVKITYLQGFTISSLVMWEGEVGENIAEEDSEIAGGCLRACRSFYWSRHPKYLAKLAYYLKDLNDAYQEFNS